MTRFGAVGDVAQLILITFFVVSHHALKYYFLFIAAPPEYEIPPPQLKQPCLILGCRSVPLMAGLPD